jgi:hypothetical protein
VCFSSSNQDPGSFVDHDPNPGGTMNRPALVRACACLSLAAALCFPAVSRADSEPAKGPAAMDPKAMQEMMAKAAAPGPFHARLQELAGTWNVTISSTMDPSAPPQVSKGTSVVKTLMGGRYSQETSTSNMMGMPFQGLGLTGYDNTLKKYVSVWADNFGTGLMMSEGTPDESGDVINWTAQAPEPMTGQMAHYRMVTRFAGKDKHSYEMFGLGPDGKEMKMMEIVYSRKAKAGGHSK